MSHPVYAVSVCLVTVLLADTLQLQVSCLCGPGEEGGAGVDRLIAWVQMSYCLHSILGWCLCFCWLAGTQLSLSRVLLSSAGTLLWALSPLSRTRGDKSLCIQWSPT